MAYSPEPGNGILQKIYELERENNRMLHAMRRGAMWSFLFRIIWWAVVLGLPIWFYYHYFGPLMNSYGDLLNQLHGGSTQTAQQLPTTGGGISSFFGYIKSLIPGMHTATTTGQ